MLVKAISGRKRVSEGTTIPDLILQSHSGKDREVLAPNNPRVQWPEAESATCSSQTLTTIGRVKRVTESHMAEA